MKKKLIVILFIFICTACSNSITNQEKESALHINEDPKADSKNENNNDIEDARKDHESDINSLCNYLDIKNKDDFIFDFEEKSKNEVLIKITSKELQNAGGTGTIGTYVINQNGDISEYLIPDILIGSWKSQDQSISYIIGYDSIEIDDYEYKVTSCTMLENEQGIHKYDIKWDIDAFRNKYPGMKINPQSFVFEYDIHKKTIHIGEAILNRIDNGIM